MHPIKRVSLLVCLVSSLIPVSASAMQHRLEGRAFAALERPLADRAKLRIERVPLADGELATLQIERFEVMAPNGKVVVYDSEGNGKEVTPVPMAFFRGSVAGVKNSLVFLSTNGQNIEGFVFSEERKFMLASRKPMRGAMGRAVERDILIDEIPPQFEFAQGEGYTCDFEGELIAPSHGMVPQSLSSEPRAEAALTGTQQTVLNLAIESDSALYTNFGSNAVSVETFIRNLIAAAATIYQRDLDTDLDIVHLGIRTTTDPWAVNPGTTGTWNGASTSLTTLNALLEYGDYWHNTPPISRSSRSAAMLLSGQTQTSGIAWTDNVCSTEFNASQYNAPGYTHYGGPYAYCGGMGSNGNVPNPDGLPNYGVPASNYWPLLQVAHELGHTVQSSHTHCIAVNPATYGRSFVDHCVTAGGCYGGATSIPAEKGTIMSYCHLYGGTNSRFTFGQPGEASEQVISLMRTRLDQKTPVLSTITAPTSVVAGNTGVASVSNTGLTYTWSIVNGTFTGGVTTITGPSVTFTAAVNPVVLTVIATNTLACSITDTINVAVTSSLAAPTGLTATATGSTSVGLAWNAVGTATGYQIFRSSNGTGGFAQIGTSVGNSYDDPTASANTAYLYRVRATNASSTSTDSNYDLATTVVFTDPVLSTGVSVKAAHMVELRTAVNAVRSLAGIGPPSFTDPLVVPGLGTRAVHVNELRTYLSAARTTLGLPALTFTDTLINNFPMKALHVTEIRNGTQ